MGGNLLSTTLRFGKVPYQRKAKGHIPQYEPIVPEEMRQAMIDAFDELIWIRPSPDWDCHGKRFEEEIAKFVDGKYAVNLNSGTAAVFLGLKALGVGPGDEVITVPNTYISPIDAIIGNGAKPVFVDVDPDTFNIQVSAIEHAITPRTRVIMPIHHHGHAVDMDPVMEIAERHGVNVLEDACQALGAGYKGRKVGTIGLAGTYSYTRNKPMSCGGDGGVLVTNSPVVARTVSMLSNHGRGPMWVSGHEAEDSYCAIQHEMCGLLFRQNEILSAMARVQLRYLQGWNEERRAIAARYTRLLHEFDTDLILPVEKPYAWHSWWRYIVRTPRRDQLRLHLASKGVEARAVYGTPNHLDYFYRTNFGFKEGDYPITERLAKEVLGLPIFPGLTFEEVDHIVEP